MRHLPILLGLAIVIAGLLTSFSPAGATPATVYTEQTNLASPVETVGYWRGYGRGYGYGYGRGYGYGYGRGYGHPYWGGYNYYRPYGYYGYGYRPYHRYGYNWRY